MTEEKDKTILELKRQRSTYKKALKELTEAIIKFNIALDKVMKEPSSYERGKKIAKIQNFLDRENQTAMHFVLGYSFRKINNMTQKAVTNLGECSECGAPIDVTNK